RILLGPAERVEIVVEMATGDDVVLRSYEQDLASASPIEAQNGAKDTFDILRVRADGDIEASPSLEHPGDVSPAPDVPDDATIRTFTLEGHGKINGRKMDMNRIDVVIPASALEIWRVESNSQPHTFHIHGSTFHVLEVDGY